MNETEHKYVTLSQIEQLRDACYSDSGNMALRNEVLVVILSDFGLRVSEAVQLRRSMFALNEGYLELPGELQKQYSKGNKSPSAARMQIDPWEHFATQRLLKQYFASDWWQNQSGDYVFPSRKGDSHISTRQAQRVIKDLAITADVSPRTTGAEPAEPSDMHPHALRHSLASYALQDQETRLIDVRQRLRHESILTTEQIYEHFQLR